MTKVTIRDRRSRRRRFGPQAKPPQLRPRHGNRPPNRCSRVTKGRKAFSFFSSSTARAASAPRSSGGRLRLGRGLGQLGQALLAAADEPVGDVRKIVGELGDRRERQLVGEVGDARDGGAPRRCGSRAVRWARPRRTRRGREARPRRRERARSGRRASRRRSAASAASRAASRSAARPASAPMKSARRGAAAWAGPSGCWP